MLRSLGRYALLALSIVGSATLLFSCKSKSHPVYYDYETLLTESSEHRTITMMENGQRSYIFSAPLIEGYSMATNPYQEFRRGIDMTTYTSDSLSLIDATIKAQYAIYYERQKLWEAKGNVVINKFNRSAKDTTITDTTKIFTQQLFWNATTKKIYSNVDTKILQKDGWHFGVGFEADEDMKNIHFRKYSSEVEFDMTPAPKEEGEKSGENANESKPKRDNSKEEVVFGESKESSRKARERREDRIKIGERTGEKDNNKAKMQVVGAKSPNEASKKSEMARPNSTIAPNGSTPPSTQDNKPPRGATSSEDRQAHDVARQNINLNADVANPAMERGSQIIRPTAEKGSQTTRQTSERGSKVELKTESNK